MVILAILTLTLRTILKSNRSVLIWSVCWIDIRFIVVQNISMPPFYPIWYRFFFFFYIVHLDNYIIQFWCLFHYFFLKPCTMNSIRKEAATDIIFVFFLFLISPRPRSRSRDSGDENENIQERHFRPHFLQAPGDLIVQEGKLCRMDCKVTLQTLPHSL